MVSYFIDGFKSTPFFYDSGRGEIWDVEMWREMQREDEDFWGAYGMGGGWGNVAGPMSRFRVIDLIWV